MLNLFDNISPESLVPVPRQVALLKQKARLRAKASIYNREKNYTLQMIPEQGSASDQMKELYGVSRP